MDSSLVELLCDGVAAFPRPIVRIIDDDLSSCIEEVPDLLLASLRDHLPKLDRLRAFLSLRPLQRVLRRLTGQIRTEGEVIWREFLRSS